MRFASRLLECFALRNCHKFQWLRVCYVLQLRASVMLRFVHFIVVASRFRTRCFAKINPLNMPK